MHEKHNIYTLDTDKRSIELNWLSSNQKELSQNEKPSLKGKKLVLTLKDKKNYVLCYRNLQKYLSKGMRLKKVHRVLEFKQERWMKEYNETNTEFRVKAKRKFGKDFSKLMNNLGFGKTMENLRNRTDIRVLKWSKER